MTALFWTSALLGAALGAANAAASGLIIRAARGRSQRSFMTLLFGGMAARMAGLLAAIAIVVAFVPVELPAFVGALGATFALGLVAEVYLLTRPARVAGA